jgi:hypothetical protein
MLTVRARAWLDLALGHPAAANGVCSRSVTIEEEEEKTKRIYFEYLRGFGSFIHFIAFLAKIDF